MKFGPRSVKLMVKDFPMIKLIILNGNVKIVMNEIKSFKF
jgi:hypothetical protein